MRPLRSFLTSLPACAVALIAMPLWAQESAKTVANTETATKAGMPQLDMAFYPSQIFWLVVTFVLLYILMKRFALPGVERTQGKRQALIVSELAAATNANDAAKRIMAEYEKILADARAQAQAAVIDITTQAAKKSMDQQHAQQQVLLKNVQLAEAKIAAAREAAIRDLQSNVNEIAGAALEKVAGFRMQVKS